MFILFVNLYLPYTQASEVALATSSFPVRLLPGCKQAILILMPYNNLARHTRHNEQVSLNYWNHKKFANTRFC
jgi:hypothetical protein